MKINDNSVLLVNHCVSYFSSSGFLEPLLQAYSWPCRPLPGRGLMYLLYPKNSTRRRLRENATPRSDKCQWLFSDCATTELSMPAWNWNVADSKKNYFRPDHGLYFPIWQSKKCPTISYAVNLWLKPVSATGASLQCRIFKGLSLSNTVVFLVTLISHCLSRSDHHMYMIKIEFI